MTQKVKVRMIYEISNHDEVCEVRYFDNCETRDELVEWLIEIGDEAAAWSVTPDADDVDALWAAIEAARQP